METTNIKKSLNNDIFGVFNNINTGVNTAKKAFSNNYMDIFFKPFDPISGAEKEGDKNIEDTTLDKIFREVNFLKNKAGKQWMDEYNFICNCKREDSDKYTKYELTREKEVNGKKLIQKSSYFIKNEGFLKVTFYRKTFEEYISIKGKKGFGELKPLWGYEIYPEGAKPNYNLMVIDNNFPVMEYEIIPEGGKKKLIYRCLYFVKDSDETRNKFY